MANELKSNQQYQPEDDSNNDCFTKDVDLTEQLVECLYNLNGCPVVEE